MNSQPTSPQSSADTRANYRCLECGHAWHNAATIVGCCVECQSEDIRGVSADKRSKVLRQCRNLWCRVMHSMFATPCVGSDISGWYCRICGKVMR
jgi:hypothetical protein